MTAKTEHSRPTRSTSPEDPDAISVAQNEVVIKASRGWINLDLREIWHYRELLFFLVWRDILLRYRQTLLGVGWAVLQPLVTMVVFTVLFDRIAQVSSSGVPYPIFSYSALVPWVFFSNAVTRASASLVSHQRLITKVYLPRLIIPAAAVFSGCIDLMVACTILIGMMIYYGIIPTVAILTLPVFVLMAALTALGIGLWLSALNVRYRDIQYVVPFLLQLGLFATPIAYPSDLVPSSWALLYSLNPMVAVVEGFRWALLGNKFPSVIEFSISLLIGVVVLGSGLFYFKRVERTFSDIV